MQIRDRAPASLNQGNLIRYIHESPKAQIRDLNMILKNIPLPSAMPLDRIKWKDKLDRSNFINSYYMYRDVLKCTGNNLLIIGPGQGLDTVIFKWKKFNVTTLDIDPTFNPDVIGSVHSMPMFTNKQFDTVIISHVLEHLPSNYLDTALEELSRIANHTIVYLPVTGRHGCLRLTLGFRNFKINIPWDFFNPLEKPDGKSLSYCEGQHYWEIGLRGYQKKQMRLRFKKYFKIVKEYRNYDWLPSYNYILQANNNR